MVVQPAVGDQKCFATGDFFVHHLTHVDTGLRYQVATQFHHDFRLWQLVPRSVNQAGKIGGYRGQLKPLLPREVGYAQPAADIQPAHRPGRTLGQPECQLEGLGLRFHDGVGAQVLGAAEDVETHKIQR